MDSPRAPLLLLLILAASGWAAAAGDGCSSGCALALASYYIAPNDNLTYIASLFGISDYRTLLPYNNFDSPDSIPAGARANVYFRCNCLSLPTAPGSTYLAGNFTHKVAGGQTYTSIAGSVYNNLTTPEWLQATNTYPANNIPDTATVNVTVNCSCGDPNVSEDYGLFLTYPLRSGETLNTVAATNNFSSPEQISLLRKYNPGMENVTGRGLVYIPVKDPDGSYHPLKPPGQPLSFTS